MINNKALNKLEYFTVLQQLGDFAVSPVAKDKVSKLLPFDDIDRIRYELSLTSEALSFINYGVVPDFSMDDATEPLEKAKISSTLSMRELLMVMRLLRLSRNMKESVLSFNLAPVPLIKDVAAKIYSDRNLEDDIDFCIVSEEEMNDNASDELKSIRQRIRKTNSDIREKLNSFTKSKALAPFLQDSIVTIRNDRYVIPVKNEYKNSVQGLVHDQSASGSTVFIEPLAIVNLNNDLRTLMIEEKQEIDRILADFTKRVGGITSFLRNNQNTISVIDVYFAKARYAIETKSALPSLNEKGFVKITNARHPLINKDRVVPISISLGVDYSIVIVTGPNTGGKTVSLKTVGLLSLMAYSGMFIPSSDDSQIALFSDIYCDIGDEQSIQQSLSTFSSHIVNVSSILQKVNPNTLVLIDELGAGTEPNEGSALALAITEYLLKSGTRGILTTHYGSLKEYALVTQGVRNACMEFDPKTFAPTYKLILGVPGSSNAIQIASNLGLNSEIIINARSKISSEKQSFEKVLQNAEQIRQQYEKQKDEIESKAVDLTNELQKAKEQNKILAQEREKLLKNSRVEAKQIITDAQNDAEELLDQLKKIVHTAQLDEKSLFEARSVVKKLNNRKYVTDDKDDDDSLFLGENVKFDSLQVGSKVFVKSLNTVGVVQRIEKGEKAQIKCGNITSVVPASDLYDFVDTSEKQVKTAKTTKVKLRTLSAQSEINLIGQTIDEAIPNVDKFLDEAVLGGLKEVRVVHGMGTGRLRKALHDHFRVHPNVDEFRLGVYGEGESGVTIVTLK